MAVAAQTQAQDATPAVTAPLTVAPASQPVLVNAAQIRTQRINHFNAKLNAAPHELKAQCRYESEVGTAPPARRVALTFDDGPEPGQTEAILATLAQYKLRATFFMIGQKAKRYPELLAQVRSAGHLVIANHSWNHPNFHDINATEQAQEVLRAEEVMAADLQPKLFRYPYGNSSCETNALLHARGYQIVGWHVDSCDWAFDRTGSVDAHEAATCGVLAQFHGNYAGHVLSAVRAHNGGIVLMHEIHPNTVRQLGDIVRALLADGFSFGAVDDAEFASSLR